MLLPDKHISLAESLIGLGSFLLETLTSPKDVDLLWHEFEKIRGNEYPAYHSFDNLILTLNMLYAIDAIKMNSNGQIIKINRK
jgi:hypothetical protein